MASISSWPQWFNVAKVLIYYAVQIILKRVLRQCRNYNVESNNAHINRSCGPKYIVSPSSISYISDKSSEIAGIHPCFIVLEFHMESQRVFG